MAKSYETIGYADQVETAPSVWEDQITEKQCYVDVERNIRRMQPTDNLNDDLCINNQLSFIADPYAMNNFHNIRYATFMGTKWKVTTVEVKFPRLTLQLGNVYNDGTSGG